MIISENPGFLLSGSARKLLGDEQYKDTVLHIWCLRIYKHLDLTVLAAATVLYYPHMPFSHYSSHRVVLEYICLYLSLKGGCFVTFKTLWQMCKCFNILRYLFISKPLSISCLLFNYLSVFHSVVHNLEKNILLKKPNVIYWHWKLYTWICEWVCEPSAGLNKKQCSLPL